LAPETAVASEWLPAGKTTQAAWQLMLSQEGTAEGLTGNVADGAGCGVTRGVRDSGTAEAGDGDGRRSGRSPVGDEDTAASAGPTDSIAAAEQAHCNEAAQLSVYDARSLQRAFEGLGGCREVEPSSSDSVPSVRPGLQMQQYFTALAQVRPLASPAVGTTGYAP